MPALSEKELIKMQVLVLGDMNTGKTSLISRFMFDTFETGYYPTFGIDFLTKMLYTTEHVVRLQFWDTAGRKCFESLIPTYVRDTRLVVINFSVAKRSSYDVALDWVRKVRAEHGESAYIMLAANKSDVPAADRMVPRDEIEAKAEELGVALAEVSAQSGLGVKAMMERVVRAGVKKLNNETEKKAEDGEEKANDQDALDLPNPASDSLEPPVTACCTDVFGGFTHFLKHTIFGQAHTD